MIALQWWLVIGTGALGDSSVEAKLVLMARVQFLYDLNTMLSLESSDAFMIKVYN